MIAVDTAQIAANVKAEIPAMLDHMGTSATFTRREIGIRTWMLDAIEVSTTPTTVTVRFPRGDATTAYFLGSAVLDRASDDYFDAGGVISEDGDRTYTLTY